MAKVILCVTEGEKTEVKIIPQLQKHFMTHDKLEIISFEAEIYQFYRQIKDLNDDFLDTFAVLKIRHPQDCNGLIKQDTLIGNIYTASRGVYESNKVHEKADLQFRI